MSPVRPHLPFTNLPIRQAQGKHLALIYHLSFTSSVWSMVNAKSMANGQCELVNAAGGGLG